MGVFDGLEPRDVLTYFEQICAVPHPSGHPQWIVDYCENFAKAHALRYIRDTHGNIVIFRNGNNEKEPVILQGHLDMVCVKEDGVQIDFLHDGVPVYADGTCIRARGTSLGADDGIGAAMILAVLSSDQRDLPPIEAVLTFDEEVGMLGAAALDASVLRGRRMINLDTEYEDVIYIACAGGERATITCITETAPVQGQCFCAKLSGFAGGHSGTEIGTGRQNAARVMAQILHETPDIRLCSLVGGEVDNAIPSACTAVFRADRDAFLAAWRRIENSIRADELNATLTVNETDTGDALTAECTQSVLSLILALPNGVQKWSSEIESFVETSLNLGVCRIDTNRMELHYSVRSSVDGDKQALIDSMRKTAEQYGVSFETSGAYPAWQYRSVSPLRDATAAAFKKIRGEAPKLQAIHAGLECGLFCGKIPELDCISIGPDIANIHSPDEHMDARSAERVYAILLETLRNL